MNPRALASRIEHTLLRADAGPSEIDRLCVEAVRYGFAGVCVHPSWVSRARQRLAGSPVLVVTVVGFPLGAGTRLAKAVEAAEAVAAGAGELDMVVHLGALRSGEDAWVGKEIEAVVEAAGEAPVKVILETALLEDDEKRRGCRLAVAAGARFVKTSTGFGPGGATVEDVRLLRACVGPDFGVKAAGGIRTSQQAEAMLAAGADRLGTSAGPSILAALDEGARP